MKPLSLPLTPWTLGPFAPSSWRAKRARFSRLLGAPARLVSRLVSRCLLRSYALDRLDLELRPYLDFDGGFFIEAGANDGVAQSNTLYLERYRGWSGLLVEPIPELAARCRKNRPLARVVNAALVPFDFSGQTVAMRYCGLMSVVQGGMRSADEEREHVRVGSRIQRLEPYDIEVPARTLSSLLDEERVARVDFLSLDVEGFEASALRGLDLERHAPTWMLVEARYREEIDACLLPRYEVVASLSHHDVLYRRRDG